MGTARDGSDYFVYCAVDDDNIIQWVKGSSNKTMYFKTPTYLHKAVEYHNRYHQDDPWRVAKFFLREVKYDAEQ